MKRTTRYSTVDLAKGWERTTLRRLIFLLCAIALAATLADAQNSRSRDSQARLGFGPQVGLHSSQSSDAMRVMGGAALRIRLSQALGVEGSINYREDDYLGGAIQTKSWPVMVTGMIYPLPIVYGALGAGWYNTSVDYQVPGQQTPVFLTSESKQEFGWHFGGGVEIPAGPGSFVGDIRYVFLNYNFQKFPGSDGVKSNFYVLTFGYLFGL